MNARSRTTPFRRDAAALADDAAGGAHAAASNRDEFKRLIADAEDLVRKVAHLTDDDIARVRAKVEDALAAARRVAEQGAVRIKSGTREIAASTDGYVREHPWKAAGVAAALGMLVAIVSSRRWSAWRNGSSDLSHAAD